MTIENLVSLRGPLAETFPQLDSDTIQHASELTIKRGTNEELRDQWFWTADGPIYTDEKDVCGSCGTKTKSEQILYLTNGKDNPIFRDIENAVGQLINNGNYVPKQEDLETAIKSETTLRVKLSDLDLYVYSSEFSYFEIDTKAYDELNSEQREVAERVYGQGNDFIVNMKMLKDDGINKTRVYVLNPEYVKEHAKDNAIARACWLNGFGYGSNFGANDWGVVYSNMHLRGVRREEIAEGDAWKISTDLEMETIKSALDLGNAFKYKGQLYVPIADGIEIPK